MQSIVIYKVDLVVAYVINVVEQAFFILLNCCAVYFEKEILFWKVNVPWLM